MTSLKNGKGKKREGGPRSNGKQSKSKTPSPQNPAIAEKSPNGRRGGGGGMSKKLGPTGKEASSELTVTEARKKVKGTNKKGKRVLR